MNSDTIKGILQKVGGRVEESAGALVGDENLKVAGKEDQLAGAAREAWGNVKDAGGALLDQAKAARFNADAKSEAAHAYEKNHAVDSDTEPRSE